MVLLFENSASLRHEADQPAAHTSESKTALGGGGGGGAVATGSSSPAGAALGAAPDADSFAAAGAVDAASGPAALSGVVDAGGISSSDVELSEEAACVWGVYHSLRGSGPENLDPSRKCNEKRVCPSSRSNARPES